MKKTILLFVVLVLVAVVAIVLNKKSDSSKTSFEVATIAPLTGTAAEVGKLNVNGARLAVRDISASQTTPWLLTVEDSKSSPKDAVQAVNAVWAKGTPTVIMTHQGPVSAAVAPVIAAKGAVMLYIAATDAPKAAHSLAFRIYPDPAYVARQTVDQIMEPAKVARLALFCVNDEFGIPVAKAIRERAAQSNITIVFDEGYNAATTDFRPTLTKLSSVDAQALHIVGIGPPLGRAIAQARESGFTGLISSGPELQFADVLKGAGQAAEGAQFLDLGFDADAVTEPTKTFVVRYTAEYKTRPTVASALVYDSWTIVSRAKANSPTGTASEIATNIIKLGQHDGLCGQIKITAERDFIYPLVKKTIRGGHVVTEP